MVICSLISGNLSDRIEPRIISTIGMALTTVGMVILVFVSIDSSVTLILVSLFIQGLGFGFFVTPNTNAIMGSVEKKFYGVASGTMGTMRLTGQAFSMGLVLLLISLLIGQAQISPGNYPQFIQTMKISFSFFAVLCFLGIFASIVRGKMHSEQKAG